METKPVLFQFEIENLGTPKPGALDYETFENLITYLKTPETPFYQWASKNFTVLSNHFDSDYKGDKFEWFMRTYTSVDLVQKFEQLQQVQYSTQPLQQNIMVGGNSEQTMMLRYVYTIFSYFFNRCLYEPLLTGFRPHSVDDVQQGGSPFGNFLKSRFGEKTTRVTKAVTDKTNQQQSNVPNQNMVLKKTLKIEPNVRHYRSIFLVVFRVGNDYHEKVIKFAGYDSRYTISELDNLTEITDGEIGLPDMFSSYVYETEVYKRLNKAVEEDAYMKPQIIRMNQRGTIANTETTSVEYMNQQYRITPRLYSLRNVMKTNNLIYYITDYHPEYITYAQCFRKIDTYVESLDKYGMTNREYTSVVKLTSYIYRTICDSLYYLWYTYRFHHGDFHYENLLIKDYHVSKTLSVIHKTQPVIELKFFDFDWSTMNGCWNGHLHMFIVDELYIDSPSYPNLNDYYMDVILYIYDLSRITFAFSKYYDVREYIRYNIMNTMFIGQTLNDPSKVYDYLLKYYGKIQREYRDQYSEWRSPFYAMFMMMNSEIDLSKFIERKD